MRLRDEITIIPVTEGPADRYGNPTEVEGAAVTVAASVQPMDATEDEINRATRVSRYNVLVEADVTVSGLSLVEWQGRDFEIIGEPKLYSYRNGAHHQEFMIREVLG